MSLLYIAIQHMRSARCRGSEFSREGLRPILLRYHRALGMGIGIRIENLRKVYAGPPPSAIRGGGGFSFTPQRSGGRKEKKKKFEVLALDCVSLEIQAGEIFGLLGPNGAVKPTTIGILTPRTEPTSGRAFIGPHDVWKQQVEAKRLIGVVPQRP